MKANDPSVTRSCPFLDCSNKFVSRPENIKSTDTCKTSISGRSVTKLMTTVSHCSKFFLPEVMSSKHGVEKVVQLPNNCCRQFQTPPPLVSSHVLPCHQTKWWCSREVFPMIKLYNCSRKDFGFERLIVDTKHYLRSSCNHGECITSLYGHLCWSWYWTPWKVTGLQMSARTCGTRSQLRLEMMLSQKCHTLLCKRCSSTLYTHCANKKIRSVEWTNLCYATKEWHSLHDPMSNGTCYRDRWSTQ